MQNLFKKSLFLFLSFILMIGLVSCGGDNLKERLELAKNLDLYSYSFVYGKEIIKDTYLVSTYESLGFTFKRISAKGEPIDLDKPLEAGEAAIMNGSSTSDKDTKVSLNIVNQSKVAKSYKDCTIMRANITGNPSIILPKGIYYNMKEEELVSALGKPDEIIDKDAIYIYNYYEYPYKEDNSLYSATGNGYSFTIVKSSMLADSFTCNMGLKPNEGLLEFSGLSNKMGQKAAFTSKLEIPNSSNCYGLTNKIQTVIKVNDIPYIVYIDTDFDISLAKNVDKPLDYPFLFEKVCDPIDQIEFVPKYMDHNGTSGYSYGFRDRGSKYACKMNFVNSQAYITDEGSYIAPLNPGDKITTEAKEAFKELIKAFSTNLQFEIVE